MLNEVAPRGFGHTKSGKGDEKYEKYQEESTMPNVNSTDKKIIKARVKNLFKKDIKGTVSGVNEDEKSYEKFIRQAREKREAIKKRGVERARKDSEYRDRVSKGIKFYDKKGSGRMVGGRKTYG